MFPQKTYEKMIKILKKDMFAKYIYKKFTEIANLSNIDKKNRWFGYYQRVGEEIGLWTLQEVRDWVREERDENGKTRFNKSTS